MPRGQYERKQRPAHEEPPLAVHALPQSEPPATHATFAALVEAIQAEPLVEHDEPPAPPSVTETIAASIRAANLAGRFGEAAALNTVATTLGELRRAIDGLPAMPDGGPLTVCLAMIATIV